MNLTHLSPAGLHTNPSFSQGVRIDGGTIVVVGGQNGTDATDIVSDDLGEQTKQAFRKVLTVLAAAGADQRHVARAQHLPPSRRRPDRRLPSRRRGLGPAPTTITVLPVLAFARPDVMVEIDALAVV